MSDVRLDIEGPVARVTMDRSARRNALDPGLLRSLAEAVEQASIDEPVRVVVLTGAGEAFSAGADLAWMGASRTLTESENRREAEAMAAAFEVVDRCPKALVARINGHAIGGGAGLVACADVAVAAEEATFAFAEVRLGLVPATISPYVLRSIGPGIARELFTTGRSFDAAEARRIGLVHEVVPSAGLDDAVEARIEAFMACAPGAVTANKRLVRDASASFALADLPDRIAQARAGDEGQEGIAAFLERRPAGWSRSAGS